EGGLPQYLKQGTQVGISGDLKVREYDDKDGNKRTSVEVGVDKLDLIGGKDANQNDSQGRSQNQGSQQSNGNNASQDPFSAPVDDDIPF
ncbi:MAG: single-stranded DNA-binding protein, partial [Ghiorsea sp.]